VLTATSKAKLQMGD